jgi:hypothetical protein
MVRFRSVIAFEIAAWLLLALAVGLIAFSVGEDHDTTWTPWPTKVVFDWLYSVPSSYRFLAAAVLGCCGGAMAVATVRRWKAMLAQG